MRISAIIAAISLAFTTLISATAGAQAAACGHRDAIVAQLADKHKEQQAVIGMSKDGRLLEIWSSYKSRSFTVLMTSPTMRSCVVASGSDLALQQPREFIARFEF